MMRGGLMQPGDCGFLRVGQGLIRCRHDASRATPTGTESGLLIPDHTPSRTTYHVQRTSSDSILAQPAVEGTAAEAEGFGGAVGVAFKSGEGFFD